MRKIRINIFGNECILLHVIKGMNIDGFCYMCTQRRTENILRFCCYSCIDNTVIDNGNPFTSDPVRSHRIRSLLHCCVYCALYKFKRQQNSFKFFFLRVSNECIR